MPSCRRCGPRCCRTWWRPSARNLARKQDNGALFEVGPRFTGATAGRAGGGAGRGPLRRRPSRGTGPRARGRSMRSTPRPMRWRRWPPSASSPRACRSRPTRRPGTIPGRSGCLRQGRAVLASFGELHPRVLRAVRHRGGRWPPSRSTSTRCRRPKQRTGKARRQPGAAALSAGRPRLRLRRRRGGAGPAPCSTRSSGVDRKLIREVRLFDVYAGQGVAEGRSRWRWRCACRRPTAR